MFLFHNNNFLFSSMSLWLTFKGETQTISIDQGGTLLGLSTHHLCFLTNSNASLNVYGILISDF